MTNNRENQYERQYRIDKSYLLSPPPKLHTIELHFDPSKSRITETISHPLIHSRSASDFRHIQQSSVDTNDDDSEFGDHGTTITTTSYRNRSLLENRTKQPSNSNAKLNVSFQHLRDSQTELLPQTYANQIQTSDPSLTKVKHSKQTRIQLRSTLFQQRIRRRLNTSLPSSAFAGFHRRRSLMRQNNILMQTSKWFIVRNRLHDIAMMNESYARRMILDNDPRWIKLREQVRKQVLDMREMSILRRQNENALKKTNKANSILNDIPTNEVVHVEHDGRIYTLGTRDLILGNDEDQALKLDIFAHLEARRRFQIKQNLLKAQQGRTRLKKKVAFIFCLLNLFSIATMLIIMFMSVLHTIVEFKTYELR